MNAQIVIILHIHPCFHFNVPASVDRTEDQARFHFARVFVMQGRDDRLLSRIRVLAFEEAKIKPRTQSHPCPTQDDNTNRPRQAPPAEEEGLVLSGQEA